MREAERKQFLNFILNSAFNHANALGFLGEEVKVRFTGMPCYMSITKDSGLKLDELYLFFPTCLWEKTGARDWTDWVINRSQYKEAFLTKDLEEAEHLGISINPDCPRAKMVAGVNTIRNAFESNYWAWEKLREWGYTEEESYALCMNIGIKGGEEEGYFCPDMYLYQGHLFIPPLKPYSEYLGLHYKSVRDTQTLRGGFSSTPTYEGSKYKNFYSNSGEWDGRTVYNCGLFGGTKTKITRDSFGYPMEIGYLPVNKDVTELLLNYLKGLDS